MYRFFRQKHLLLHLLHGTNERSSVVFVFDKEADKVERNITAIIALINHYKLYSQLRCLSLAAHLYTVFLNYIKIKITINFIDGTENLQTDVASALCSKLSILTMTFYKEITIA